MTDHEAQAPGPSNDHSDTELTVEEREAMRAFKAASGEEVLTAFGRASDSYSTARGSGSPSREILDSMLASRSAGLVNANRGLRSMAAQADRERVEGQRRVDDSENFKLMAGILVEMDRERIAGQESRRKQTFFNAWMAAVGVLLALGGVVVPFVIEAIKGWK